MINKKYLKNLRCKEINNKNNFIFKYYSETLKDSLEIINLNFQNILILGDEGEVIYEFIHKKFNKSSIEVYDFKNIIRNNVNVNIDDIDLLEIEDNKYDLIISNYVLSFSDNLEILLRKIINSLAPNGFFLAVMPSPINFYALKSAMIKTDIDVYGGAYNRFNKSIDLKEIIDILKKIIIKTHL